MDDDRRARFEAVVRLVGEPLRKYAARRTDPDTAEDVVADAFLVLWRRLDDVPEGAELPWSYAVARNCLANAQRSARRHRSLVARLTCLPAPQGHDRAPDLPDVELDEALRSLPDADREVLTLWAWEELRPAEIATVLGVSVNAVNIRLHRARNRLADRLHDGGPRKVSPPPGQKQVKEGGSP